MLVEHQVSGNKSKFKHIKILKIKKAKDIGSKIFQPKFIN
jgi:hypothetical protein